MEINMRSPHGVSSTAGANSRADSGFHFTSNAIEQFRQAMLDTGIEPPENIKDSGKIERFSTNGKRGDDGGWYRFHSDGIPNGVFGDHRTGVQHSWIINIGRPLTPDETTIIKTQAQQARLLAEAENAKRAKKAADTSKRLIAASTPASPDHPYLKKKAVSPVSNLRELDSDAVKLALGYTPKSKGEALQGRILLAPVMLPNGVISTCELIDEFGRKSAIAGGKKADGFWAVRPLNTDEPVILIGEGVSTCLSVYEATGSAVIASLSGVNLKAVGETVRSRYPDAAIAILADLKDGSPYPAAAETAEAVGGSLLIPTTSGTDFNDQHVEHGLESLKVVLHRFINISRETGETGGTTSNHAGYSCLTSKNAGETGGTDDTSFNDETAKSGSDGSIPSLEQRPKFVVLDDWLQDGSRRYRPGVWYFGVKQDKQGNLEPINTWVSSPIQILAVTHDPQQNNVGRLIRFKTTLGHWRKWAMPMELLAGDLAVLRGELLSMGAEQDPTPSARNLFAQYLNSPAPKRRINCALSVGWCGKSFVLPDTVIGNDASGVIFQSGERNHEEFTVGGTLDSWRTEIAAKAIDNPILTLALSAAFAGPLLAKVNAESGGIHFVGDSSTGKTTAIEAACSVWGGGNFKRSWRSTSNGMEGVATMFNDCLLALDEISECDPREVGNIVYSLGNGRGKQRSTRTGRARPVSRWRCFVLSSGERTIATTMAEGGHRVKAGQEVRLLNIPVSRRHGAWDDLHEFSTGPAFSDALKASAVSNHGFAGRAFLERLARDERDFSAQYEDLKQSVKVCPTWADGQEKRAAARFVLLALAGELATEYGVTGWPPGTAAKAVIEGFNAWKSIRGSGNSERSQILTSVAEFIERHGDSRFSHIDTDNAVRNNRAGWYEDGVDGRVYLFNASALKEAAHGFELRRVLDELENAGALLTGGTDGPRRTQKRIAGRKESVYLIRADVLSDEC